jgi:hypothetical protein
MKRHIWIASHFHNKFRIELFKETLKSLINQTIKPDEVFISFSIQFNLDKNEVYDLFETILKPNDIKYVILFQEERKYQFEHFEKIYEYVKENNYQDFFISFIDDDDMVHESYIEETNEYIRQGYKKIGCFFYILDDIDIKYEDKDKKNLSLSKYTEFGGISCTLDFYETFINDMCYNSNNQQCDIYFSVYRADNFKSIQIDKPLYYYRKCPYVSNFNIWGFEKEITENEEYHKLIILTKELVKIYYDTTTNKIKKENKNKINVFKKFATNSVIEIEDYIISMYLYHVKDNEAINISLEDFINQTLNKYIVIIID